MKPTDQGQSGTDQPLTLDATVEILRAIGEPSRLRIVALLHQEELTVGELCQILGQSQPRISRHLRTLLGAGVVRRRAEGTSAFYTLSGNGSGAAAGAVEPDVVGRALALAATDPQIVDDSGRLGVIRADRAAEAAAFFEKTAERWDSLSELYTADGRVEAALRELIGDRRESGTLLDVGTGTGRMLRTLGPSFARATGVDLSSNMLKLARATIAEHGLDHCDLAQGNLYNLDVEPGSFDVVLVHHVLHHLDRPDTALAEAARAVSPGGSLIVVDLAPHELDHLLNEQGHRRRGIDHDDLTQWLEALGFTVDEQRRFPPSPDEAPLTVVLWKADRQEASPSSRSTHERVASR